MIYQHADLKAGISSLSRVDQRLSWSFGFVILLLMISVLVIGGLYFKGVMDREERQLSTLLTQILATSISRVSFSGRHHAQLLIEDLQNEYPDIRSLLITDLENRILASSTKGQNGVVLSGESEIAAKDVLVKQMASQTRHALFNGAHVIEITLPYHGGFDHSIQGVVQVAISRFARDQEIKRGIVLISVVVIFLLGVGILVVRKISRHFGEPFRNLASDMAATLHAIPDLLFELDRDGRYIQVLAHKEELLADTREHLLGRTIKEILPEDASSEIAAALDEAYRTGESHGRQIALTLPAGTFWFELSVARKQSEASDATHFIVLSRDITERKKTEQELYKHREHLEDLVQERTAEMTIARDEAERANAAKSEFLSRMSHELRTPLNAILGFGQILVRDAEELNDIQRDNVKEILHAGHHLLDLINEVLDLARIESGKTEIVLTSVSVDDLLQQCVSLIQPQLDEYQLKLIDHISGQGYMIQADLTRLKQVMLNFLSNAVKYNCENGSITLDSKLTNNQCLHIDISSTGHLLTTEEIAILFTPFDRLGAERAIEGTGIGLVISKHLVEAMGGVIGVESSADKGNTFWIELPLAADV